MAVQVRKELVEQLLAEAGDDVEVLGPDGLLAALTKNVLETALDAELTAHLGYEKGDAAGKGWGNSRNGSTPKTVYTEHGSVRLDVPRDRDSWFEPVIVPKHATRLAGLEARILGMYAGGMTVRDICDQLAEIYGVDVSRDVITKVTDAVSDEVRAWRSRPLDRVCPIVYLDAIVCKVRDNGVVRNKVAHLALGVDVDGRKQVLGIWVETSEGAKFWLKVRNELRARGVADVLVLVCDGLKGLPEAVEAVWPATWVQTCIVHLVRASLNLCSYKDRKPVAKPVAAALKAIYRADGEDGAAAALDAFDDQLGSRATPASPACGVTRGNGDSLLGVPTRDPPGHLHHQRVGVGQLPAAQGHAQPWALPQRRRIDQTAVSGGSQHGEERAARDGRVGHLLGEGSALNQFHIFFPGRFDTITATG